MDGRRFICCDCGALAPLTSGEDSSLISLKYGWRLRRLLREGEPPTLEARCAPCEGRRKASIAPPPRKLG
jgi:hypothetical protein